MKDCKHTVFECTCEVTYLRDVDRYTLDLKVRCKQCHQVFCFLGLPAGLDIDGAACNMDATEARLGLYPQGSVITALDGVTGFSVSQVIDL